MGPQNLIHFADLFQATVVYSAAFSTGASIAVLLVVIDRLNNQ